MLVKCSKETTLKKMIPHLLQNAAKRGVALQACRANPLDSDGPAGDGCQRKRVACGRCIRLDQELGGVGVPAVWNDVTERMCVNNVENARL